MSLETYALVTFTLDDQRYALPCSLVKRIIPAVEITPLPNEEEQCCGIINLQGNIIPVINIRHLLGLPFKEVKLEDLIIIIEWQTQIMAFVVNEANFMEAEATFLVQMESILKIKEQQYIETLIKDPSGPIKILNIEKIIGQSSSSAEKSNQAKL